MENCRECKFWDHDGLSSYGICRAVPPAGQLGWPRVQPHDWCGAFVKAQKTVENSEKVKNVSRPVKAR